MLILQYKTGQPPIGNASAHWDPNNYTSYNSYQAQWPSAGIHSTLEDAYAASKALISCGQAMVLIYVDSTPPTGVVDLFYVPVDATPNAGQWLIDGTDESGFTNSCSAWQGRGDMPEDGNKYFYYEGQPNSNFIGTFQLWYSPNMSQYNPEPECWYDPGLGAQTCYTPDNGHYPVVIKTEWLRIRILS